MKNRIISAPSVIAATQGPSRTRRVAAMGAGSLFGFRRNIQISPKTDYGHDLALTGEVSR